MPYSIHSSGEDELTIELNHQKMVLLLILKQIRVKN